MASGVQKTPINWVASVFSQLSDLNAGGEQTFIVSSHSFVVS